MDVAMTDAAEEIAEGWGPLDGLPGNPMMWILILGEMLVFAILLAGFSIARALHPAEFAASQAHLHPLLAGLATITLVTSGWLAARALHCVRRGESGRPQLVAAMLIGSGFLILKGIEYGREFAAGIGIETDTFFTLYFLITGFHALHVVMGIIVLAIVAWQNSAENIETGTAFWHMVDLVWILIFPTLYLLR